MESSIEGAERPSERELAALLAAVGDPIRLRILGLVAARPLAVHEICAALSMAQPRVSHHLAILRGQGLVEVEIEGRRRLHRWRGGVTTGALGDLLPYLQRWLDAIPDRGELDPSAPAGSRRPAADDAEGGTPAAPSALEDFLL